MWDSTSFAFISKKAKIWKFILISFDNNNKYLMPEGKILTN